MTNSKIKHQWPVVVLLLATLFAAGCGSAERQPAKKSPSGHYAQPQTGTYLPRSFGDRTETRAPKTKRKASRPKPESKRKKPKPVKADDDFVPRGGFR